MAPRRKGAFELNEVVETPKTMPLDARQLVRSKEEMLDTDSFPNGYKGLFTAERTEGKLWMLMDHQNPTLEESWKVIGPYDDTDLQTRVTALEEGGGGGVAQVQSDWNETDTTSKAFIQNKPTIPPAYDDTALASRVTALEEAEIPPPSWDEVTDKPANLATTDDVNAKILVAEYNVTTAQEIMDYMDASNEPYAPIVIKRDTNYHTVNTMFKRDDETVILRSTGTINGEYYMFTYAITGNTWAISTDYGFQRKLESGTNIKTVGGQSLLGSGDIPVSGSQVQADWNEADTASAAYIQNKPTIPEAYDDTAIQAALAGKADSSSLANVATSGSYNDLGDKPTIPEAYDDGALAARIAAVETTLPNKANTADLANVATSGSYNDLGDKPTIPAAYDDTALAGRVTAVETALPGKADSSSLATVATSGSYNDLTDKPTIPEAYDDTALAARVSANETALADRYTKAETDGKIAEAIDDVNVEHFHTVTVLPPVTDALENHEYVLVTYEQDGVTIATEEHYLFYDGVFHQRNVQVSLDGYATETYVDNAVAGKADGSSLATVATSGSYNDLADQPTIPEVYDDTALTARVTALEGRTDADTQADWNEEDTSSPAFIQNKPTIPAGITVDAAMSDTSENPVQNKVVLEAITDAVDVVDTAVQGLDTRVTALEAGVVDDALSDTSENPVQNKVIKSYVDNKTAEVRYKVEMDDAAPPESMVLKGDNEAALQPTMTFAGTSDTLEYSAENESGSYAITMPSKAYVDGALADKQDTLVSGTNIKTLNSMSLLGNGNISIEKGAGIPLDANNLPSANVIMQMVNDEALVYIDKWMIERANYDEEHTFWIHTRWGDYTRTYKFLGVEDLDAPLVLEEAPIDNAPTAPHLDTSTTTQYSSAQLRTRDGGQAVRIVVHDDYARLEVAKGNTTKTKLLYGGNYIVDKPEGTSTQLGNVVQIGTLQRESGDEVGIFEFYYRTSALPNTTSKQFTLLPLLENYTINDFIDATGMTSNGIFIGNGRTDNENRLIVQQFSKNNKHFTIRTYQDFSAQTALVKIKFIGKNEVTP